MLRTILAGALASGALLAGGGAHAQGFGVGAGVGVGYGYGGGYYGGGYGGGYGGYAPYQPSRFTLAGVRAGVTVLGVDIDGSAKLTIGAHDWNRGYAPPPPAYPVAPPPAPMPPPPGYWMGYSAPSAYVTSYGCGCAPPPPPCCGY